MKNILVGNLSFQTTEQDIRSLFEAYGAVDRVNIVTDRDSGQPRGLLLSRCPTMRQVSVQSRASTDETLAAERTKQVLRAKAAAGVSAAAVVLGTAAALVVDGAVVVVDDTDLWLNSLWIDCWQKNNRS